MEIGLSLAQRLWWAQDGAPAHQLIAVRNRPFEIFQNRVIALHLLVEWPLRSPVFFEANLENEANLLQQDPALFRRVSWTWDKERTCTFLEMVATLSYCNDNIDYLI